MSETPPPPPPPGVGGYAGAGGYAQPQTNQKAIWALVLSLLGLFCCGFFAAIPAIILGNSAKKEIAASQGMQTGHPLAVAGVVVGWVAIALSVIGLIVFLTVGTFSFDVTGT